MKNNHLYIGEVSKIFHISSDTLRYFDKEHIVVSKKAENGYRYYDDWAINFLIEYKKYRGFGFNVQQSREVLHQDSFQDLQEKFEKREIELEQHIKFEQLILDKCRRYNEYLSNAVTKPGTYQIVEMVQLSYFRFRNNNQYWARADISELYQSWSDAFPLVDPILIVPEKNSGDYYCGLGISQYYQEQIHLPETALVEKTKPGKAINTIIIAGEQNTFSTKLLDPLYSQMEKSGLVQNGELIGYYLARVHEDDGYKRYIEIFMPVRNIRST